MSTQSYGDMLLASAALGERSDCAVFAVAIAAQVKYSEARAYLQANGRKPRQSTYLRSIKAALADIGYVMIEQDLPEAKTLATLERELWAYSGTYLVFTTSHVAAITNGRLHDWAKDTKRRIARFYKVLSLDTVDF